MIKVNIRNANQASREIRRLSSQLSKSKVDKATAEAINKTLLLGRTEARKAVKAVYNIPQKNLKGVDIKRATRSNLSGHIFASTKPIPMNAFSPRFDFVSASGVTTALSVTRRGQSKAKVLKSKRRNAGVSVEIKRGERTVVPYAFLLPNSKPSVFARGEYKGSHGRYNFVRRHHRQEYSTGNDSVTPLISVTIFGAVVNPTVKQRLERVVRDNYERNMISALRRQASMS
jgi:hypothetical protein